MKSYILIHPFGGDIAKLEHGRELCVKLRLKHPEIAILYPLDTIYYMDKDIRHSAINEWCAEWVKRSDGIIFPKDAMESDGCRHEIAAAEAAGKETIPVEVLLTD